VKGYTPFGTVGRVKMVSVEFSCIGEGPVKWTMLGEKEGVAPLGRPEMVRKTSMFPLLVRLTVIVNEAVLPAGIEAGDCTLTATAVNVGAARRLLTIPRKYVRLTTMTKRLSFITN
jgi:hypothetical protein